MHEEANTPAAAPRLGVLDYLIALAAHVRLLVVLPLVVAALAFGVAATRPKVYTSTALVLLPQDALFTPAQAAAMMRSQAVFDRIAAGKLADVRPEQLQGRVTTGVSKENLVRLDVAGDTPQAAQAGADAVLRAWLTSTVPAERDRNELQARAVRAKADLANVQAALDAATKAMGSGDRLPADTTLRLASLSETADKLFTIIQWIDRRLGGLGMEVVKQAPTLPSAPELPRPMSVAIKAAIATFVVVVAGLLLLRRLQELRRDPVHGADIERLLAAFRRRKPETSGAG